MTKDKNNILKIKKLKKVYYDNTDEIIALENITLDIKDKEFISIVGPSGCGKSTLLSILCGLDKKTDGEIILDSKYKIGYMLQKDSLFPWRTVLENCLLGLEINNLLTEDNKNRVILLLKTYGLGDFINKYPNSLSGGMKQRVLRM